MRISDQVFFQICSSRFLHVRASHRKVGQEIPAVADATTRSATPATVTCKALTTAAPVDEIVCSLMVTTPPGMATTWFGAPVTLMGTPAIARLLKDELPVPALPAIWEAWAITESAVMPMPATVVLKFVREAVEKTWSGQPIVAALK